MKATAPLLPLRTSPPRVIKRKAPAPSTQPSVGNHTIFLQSMDPSNTHTCPATNIPLYIAFFLFISDDF